MNKFRQGIYTIILIVTCFVASPFIFKQIWNSSAEKKKVEKLPPISLNVPTQPAQGTTLPGQPDTQANSENGQADPGQTTAPGGEVSTDSAVQTAPVTTEAVTEAQAAVFVQSDASYFDDALLIGDSRMVGIKDYGTLKNADYFCDVGLSSYKIDSEYIDGNNFAGKLQSRTYGKVYIMLGINEVGNDFNYTTNSFGNIISTIRSYQPDAIIYILANLHVTSGAETDAISNQRINYLNSCIAQYADNKSIFYLDVNPVFDDPDGNLRSDATGDGVHVYGNYYLTWCDWLCMNTVRK